MTDITTTYPPPAAVRISADYASTDGRAPSSMYIEYADDPGPDAVHATARVLADIATHRDYTVPVAMKTWADTPTSFEMAVREQQQKLDGSST